MEAELVLRRREEFRTPGGVVIAIERDLFRLPVMEGAARMFPDDFRLSWIAFDTGRPSCRVLIDNHPPKGLHFHIDGEEAGVAITCSSLRELKKFFRVKINERFGEYQGD